MKEIKGMTGDTEGVIEAAHHMGLGAEVLIQDSEGLPLLVG